MEYNIIDVSGDARVLVPIEGEKIVLKGLEQFNFFIHDSYMPIGSQGSLTISEISTGAKVAMGDTIKEVVDKALKNINSVGHEVFEKMLSDQVSITGKPLNPQP